MKPVCVPCGLFYSMKRTGVTWEDGMPVGDSEVWKPYKLWMGDLWRCRRCGSAIIIGAGLQPMAEHFEPDYAEVRQRHGPIVVRVDDC